MQDRDQEVAVTGRRLKEGLVDEVGAGLQLLADQVEHPVDHVARGEYLAVGLDAVPGLHDLLLDDRLRHSCLLCCLRRATPPGLTSPTINSSSKSANWSSTDGGTCTPFCKPRLHGRR